MDKDTIRDFELDIIVKAWKDERFRSDLLKNPTQAIEHEFGIKVPGGMTISVHEEHENSLHLIIPSVPSNFEAEDLSDDELKEVIGGVMATGHLTGFPTTKERARLRDLKLQNEQLKKTVEKLNQDLAIKRTPDR